jgi:hypothetical protein
MVSGDEDSHQTIPDISLLWLSASAFPNREHVSIPGHINPAETCHWWHEWWRACAPKPSITSCSFLSATPRLIATKVLGTAIAIVLLDVCAHCQVSSESGRVSSRNGR